MIQTIDFSKSVLNSFPNFEMKSSNLAFYTVLGSWHCWELEESGAFLDFELTLGEVRSVNLILALCSGITNGIIDCPIDIIVNNNYLVTNFDPKNDYFYQVLITIPEEVLVSGTNRIYIHLKGTTNAYIYSATVDLFSITPSNNSLIDKSKWMSLLNPEMNIGAINLPGSHDSAAIGTKLNLSTIYKFPWINQNHTITEQLENGIRLLDIRLEIEKDIQGNYQYYACHDDLGNSLGVNRFESFNNIIIQCKEFLTKNPTETILMFLKIESWINIPPNKQDGAKRVLLDYIRFTLSIKNPSTNGQLPKLKQILGKIYLLNRIDRTLNFGMPIYFPHNSNSVDRVPKEGVRNFAYDIQDYHQVSVFEDLFYTIVNTKAKVIIEALEKDNRLHPIINFISCYFKILDTAPFPISIYPTGEILNYFGKTDSYNRVKQFGWLLTDYSFMEYPSIEYGSINLVDFIISSNFNYQGFENKFSVVDLYGNLL